MDDRGQCRGRKPFCLVGSWATRGGGRQIPSRSSSARSPRASGTRCVMSARELRPPAAARPARRREASAGSPRAPALPRAGPSSSSASQVAAGEELAAEERPGVALGGPPAEGRVRDRQRQERRASAGPPIRALRRESRSARRGKRKAYRSSTIQTALSQPSASGRSAPRSVPGIASADGASASSTTISALQIGIAPVGINAGMAVATLPAGTLLRPLVAHADDRGFTELYRLEWETA